MSESKLTKEQGYAVELRDKHLLVAAAAGSGKTYVLVERIIRRILDSDSPIDVDELLVMTFTKAAASEMRSRIQGAIEKKLAELSVGSDEYKRVRRQAAIVDAAYITTIDSFCLSVIREHCDKVDIDPGFRVADEAEMNLLEMDVAEKLLEDCYGMLDENPQDDVTHIDGLDDFGTWAASYIRSGSDETIVNLIQKVYKFAQSQAWPDQWYEDRIEELSTDQIDADRILSSDWMAYLYEYIRLVLSDLIERAHEAMLTMDEEGGPEQYKACFIPECEYMESLMDCKDMLSLSNRLSDMIEFDRLSTKQGGDQILRDRAKNVRDCYKDTLKKFADKYGGMDKDILVQQEADGAMTMRTLIILAREYDHRLAEIKKKRCIVDFGDLEHMALRILWERGEDGSMVRSSISKTYTDRFKEIYIDEYQDSNDVQEELLRSMDSGAVFMVGDVKQSIYGFRRANPELFEGKYESYAKYTGKEDEHDLRVDLSQNFRSRKSVIDSINAICERIIKPELGGIAYDADARLYPGAVFAEYGDIGNHVLPGPTEVLLCDVKDKVTEDGAKNLQARLIGKRILELTDEKTGMLVWDSGAGEYRTARYADIAILLRSQSGWSDVIVDELTAMGIPAYALSSAGYFDTVEVRTILALLSVLDNPIQDIPLAAVMRSPIIGMSDTELSILIAEYRRAYGNEKFQRLYDICNTAKDMDIDTAIKTKVEKLLYILDRYGFDSRVMKLSDLITEIYKETGYLEYESALPAGDIRRENLHMLLSRAKSYEEMGYRGVGAFNRYIENLKKYSADFGEASLMSEYDNTVRITTIHKSKGLEYPICILAGVDKRFNKQDTNGSILIDDKLGIGCDIIDVENSIKYRTYRKKAISRHIETDGLGEELRVLYVALTRAKEQLIIAATGSEFMEVEWLTSDAPYPSYRDVEGAANYLGWLKCTPLGDESLFHVSATLADELVTEEELMQQQAQDYKKYLKSLDGDEDSELMNRIFYKYSHEADTKLHTKMTVSELKMLGQDVDEERSAKKTYPDKSDTSKTEASETILRGASRGTVYHRILEHMDYTKCMDETTVRTDIDEMHKSGILSQDEYDCVDMKDFATWIDSDIGQEVASSDKSGRLRREAQYIMSIPARDIGAADSDEPVLIQGIIDAYIEYEDGITLIDYKTDRVRSGNELKDRYAMQLDYYKKALEAMKHKPVTKRIIWSFALGEAVEI